MKERMLNGISKKSPIEGASSCFISSDSPSPSRRRSQTTTTPPRSHQSSELTTLPTLVNRQFSSISSSLPLLNHGMDSQTEEDPVSTTLLQEGGHGINNETMGTSTNHNVYAQDTQGQAHIGSTRKRSHRGGNFTVEEDNQLVSAWLNISLDVIQGNDQRATQLWNRIYEYFNKYKKPFSPERSVASLTNRWSTIQKSTKKFCRFLFQIESMHPSGVDEQDKIQKAKNMYRENQKATFQFDHCWYLLRHQPKWQTHMDQLRSRRKSKNITHSPDTTLESIHLGEDHCSEEVFVDLERPHGTKAEKEEKKRKAQETSLVEMLSELKEERKILNEERREALRIAEEDRQELLRIKKRKLELEIMLIDKSKLSPMQQQYIHERQLEILAKYRTTLS
ncbi:hypothetical protein I3842_09G176500 [Carya illinoinensis]|uniref:No apical meristem-associated C-terminal domain-containing protein n=1 Tax=Carya illinoinensis TaxID=32201 RepID=A0A922E571_CARIL|nr:hypothetical protein I3842_09G176500 [Carya illinoinensis]